MYVRVANECKTMSGKCDCKPFVLTFCASLNWAIPGIYLPLQVPNEVRLSAMPLQIASIIFQSYPGSFIFTWGWGWGGICLQYIYKVRKKRFLEIVIFLLCHFPCWLAWRVGLSAFPSVQLVHRTLDTSPNLPRRSLSLGDI